MGAVTYPDPLVIEFLSERFVPVRLHQVDEADAIKHFGVGWTPGLLVLDADGREHRRMFGFHPPADFVAELALGWLQEAIDRGHGREARERAQVALERTRGDPEREAEARYFAAVAEYKATRDGTKLKSGWLELLDACPGTTWARKVEFIRG